MKAIRRFLRWLPTMLFVLCVANVLWSAVGGWWHVHVFGRKLHSYDPNEWWSYISSQDERLVIAFRETWIGRGRWGILPKGWQTVPVYWESIPPTVRFGIDRGQTFQFQTSPFADPMPKPIAPGIVLTWAHAPRTPFYTRKISIHWAWPTALASVVPLFQLARLVRRRSPGMCVRCGYDLRASSDRCPECGTPRDPAAPIT